LIFFPDKAISLKKFSVIQITQILIWNTLKLVYKE